MLGYKASKNGDTRVIVTLEIPEDAITNMKRKDIVNAETAKYRCNKAKVLKIEDEDGKEYSYATSIYYNYISMFVTKTSTLTYNVGVMVDWLKNILV